MIARAAFLAKEEDSDMSPLHYRVLLILASVYRLWGKIRLEQLQPWIETWHLPEIYAGIEGAGGQRCGVCHGSRDRVLQSP